MRAYQQRIGGFTFDVTEEGPQAGPPIVLLHGFPQTSASFQATARLLAAEGYRTIAMDQRGYSAGARPEGVAAYAIGHLVGDVLGLLDSLGLPAAHLVGHDWGSIVAWSVTAAQPHRVKTLTAVSVPHPRAMFEVLGDAGAVGAEQRKRSDYINLFRLEGGKAEDVLLANNARALHDLFSPLPEIAILPHYGALSQRPALTAALNWYRAIDVQGALDLPPVAVPTTFVWSTADVAVGRAAAERCAAYAIGDYRFVELDGVSHWIPDQAPVELTRAVVDRVRSVGD